MNLLDENIPLDQRDLLQAKSVPCRVIGQDLSRLSVADENIITLLHQLKQPTLFTRDQDFFKRGLCHAAYGLVWLDAAPAEAAMFILRFLKHRRFDSKAKRMGIVARVHHDGIQFWRHGQPRVQRVAWLDP